MPRRRPHVIPMEPDTYIFAAYSAEWEGEWPESPEDIEVEIQRYPVVGLVLYEPVDPYRAKIHPLYLDDGRVLEEDFTPVDCGESDVELGMFPIEIGAGELGAIAQVKCLARCKAWQRQEEHLT